MKILYVLLIVACMILLASGGICLEMIYTYAGQSRDSSIYFSIVSMVVETYAILVGLMGLRLTAKISTTIVVSSLLMLVWSCLMYNRPNHISVDEAFLFWVLYVLGTIFLSVLGFRVKPREIEKDWDESLLDDLL